MYMDIFPELFPRSIFTRYSAKFQKKEKYKISVRL